MLRIAIDSAPPVVLYDGTVSHGKETLRLHISDEAREYNIAVRDDKTLSCFKRCITPFTHKLFEVEVEGARQLLWVNKRSLSHRWHQPIETIERVFDLPMLCPLISFNDRDLVSKIKDHLEIFFNEVLFYELNADKQKQNLKNLNPGWEQELSFHPDHPIKPIIQQMLQLDFRQRITAKEALEQAQKIFAERDHA